MIAGQQEQFMSRALSAPREPARLDELTLCQWQAFVESHPQSTIFHHRDWIETIQAQYGFEAYIPCLRENGDVQAAIPFLSVRSPFGVRKLISLPFTDYLSVLSREQLAGERLASGLISKHPPCNSMRIRTDTKLTSMPSSSYWVRHEVRIESSLEAIVEKFKPSVHRNLRKAQRIGLGFARRVDEQSMHDFYRLHALTRQKLGIPVQPKSYFRRLHERLLQRGLGYIGLVYKGADPIAAGFFLKFNGTVTYKYAASHPAALADRPNDWLVFCALKLAGEEGYQALDFGISARKQKGLRRFKCNWGARESDVYTVPIVGCDDVPVNESKLLRLMSGLIRNSPVIVCRSLGEVLYRFAT